jgi:hypothetical protein
MLPVLYSNLVQNTLSTPRTFFLPIYQQHRVLYNHIRTIFPIVLVALFADLQFFARLMTSYVICWLLHQVHCNNQVALPLLPWLIYYCLKLLKLIFLSHLATSQIFKQKSAFQRGC